MHLKAQFEDIDIQAVIDSNIKNSEAHCHGYESSRNGGGVCIYVRNKSEYQLLASARLSNSK